MDKLHQDTFLKLVNSLKQYQRAELIEDDENLIETLYTDPFPNDFVLKTMLQNQTTLLIGRKGTGKSTIINRFQHEVRKTKEMLSLYIDVKSIYIQAKDSVPQTNLDDYNVLSDDEKERYFIYKEFLKKVIDEIKIEIDKSLFSNKIIKFITRQGVTESEFKKELDNIFNKKSKFEDITALKLIKNKEENTKSKEKKTGSEITAELKPEIKIEKESIGGSLGKIGGKISSGSSEKKETLTSIEYSQVLIRYFNIIELMNDVKSKLLQLGISRVYICLDDASELEQNALDTFIRTIVTPLNNSSEGFFKFKISFYPGRDSLPEIDRSKIETLTLDYFKLYLPTGVDKIEESAVDYTKRLLLKRFKHYFGENVDLSDFFDTKDTDIDTYYKLLFYASSNVPRFIGKILWYCGKQAIFNDKKITKSVIQNAAKQHYNDEIKVVLFKNEFIQYKDYNEQFEKEHLKNLVIEIINRAKENKRQIGNSTSKIFEAYTTNTAPSNYLFFIPEFEKLIASLELNFFITKYSQQKDRGKGTGDNYRPPQEQSVYTLNYGLCQNEDIIYDEKSDRKFRIERVFDYNTLIQNWASSQKKIICSNCDAIHSLDKLDAIQALGMICSECGQKTCKVITNEIKIIKGGVQIPENYFQVINILKVENGLSVPEIALELDKNRWAVSALIRSDRVLQSNNYIEAKNESGQNKYYITTKAINTFFSNASI
ncbi:MAG: hypothetical protein FJ266_07695 [Planctomycetes bacterium]|nr:hypothetical protein [Planctomycetota bacterium]